MINISYLTGKCDCYDTLVMIHKVTDFSNVRIYAANNGLIPLRIDSQKDLMPYYPYLITSMSSSKEDGIDAHLSERSYIDIEEEDRLKWRLNQLKKYYRRCKRNHEPFDDKEAIKKICVWNNGEENYETELVKRVKYAGERATYDGLHIPMFDASRKRLFEDMVDAGYNGLRAWTWCFGWRRLVEFDGNNDGKN